MKKLIYIALLIGLVACGKQRLDPFLYSADDSISEYLLDDYTGNVEIDLPSQYDVSESNTYLFSLLSNSEIAPRTYMIYIGDTSNIDTDSVILYCHGNSDHMDRYWPRAKLLANVGGKHNYGVLMLDYPGFGLSEGDPSEEGMYESVDLAIKWLQSHGLSDDRLMMYGFSLGSAPATELTANPRTMQPSLLMLESPFASAAVLVQDPSVVAMPSSYYTNLEIDNAEEIKKVDEPFLWMHGQDDDFLRIDTHGEVVYANYSGVRSEAFRVDGAKHSDLPEVMGFEAYLTALRLFISGS